MQWGADNGGPPRWTERVQINNMGVGCAMRGKKHNEISKKVKSVRQSGFRGVAGAHPRMSKRLWKAKNNKL